MRKAIVLTMLASAALAGAAKAEVRKTLVDCGERGYCPVYSLLLTPPDGWIVDDAETARRHVQILVPHGTTFDTASAIIYVQVFYVRDKTQTTADFAPTSNARWLAESPASKIKADGTVTRANGKPPFLGFAYDNPGKTGQSHEFGAFAPDSDTDGNSFMIDAVLSGEKAAVSVAKETYVAWLKGL